MTDNLVIPIYLNQRTVFDMLAMLEDGFSHLETVQTSRKRGSSTEGGGETEVGASNVFALLGVSLKAQLRGKKESEEQAVSTQERIHTPASLFTKLYQRLLENDSIVTIYEAATLADLKSGDIVEFTGLLKKNPFLHFLETAIRIIDMMANFEGNDEKEDGKDETIDRKGLLGQIKAMVEELRAGVVVDLVCSLVPCSHVRAVVPVYQDFFFNQTMSEVIDGEYRVLGKVTRVVRTESEGDINLLRYTGFSFYRREIIDQMFGRLRAPEESSVQLGDMTSVVTAPALQIIPIAIFV